MYLKITETADMMRLKGFTNSFKKINLKNSYCPEILDLYLYFVTFMTKNSIFILAEIIYRTFRNLRDEQDLLTCFPCSDI